MPNQAKVIFLDIDGPINTSKNVEMQRKLGKPVSSYYIELQKEKIELLSRVMQETDATLILCSSWRLGWSELGPSKAYINLQQQFAPYNINMAGWTPYINDNRGLEIKSWLDHFEKINGYRPPYIIIENEIQDLLFYHRGHIIKTTNEDGLTPKLASIAISLLNNQ